MAAALIFVFHPTAGAASQVFPITAITRDHGDLMFYTQYSC
jgi:hypothetical protein